VRFYLPDGQRRRNDGAEVWYGPVELMRQPASIFSCPPLGTAKLTRAALFSDDLLRHNLHLVTSLRGTFHHIFWYAGQYDDAEHADIHKAR